MKRVIVASKNPVKLRSAEFAFQRMFPQDTFRVEPISVSSDVPNQPRSTEMTRSGAEQRASNAMAAAPEADFWVGIEGGVSEDHGEMAAFAWIVIRSGSVTGAAQTGIFFLPRAVADLVRQGIELGVADDMIFGRTDSKWENGAVGLLTGDVIDRSRLYEHAVVLALVPFKNPQLYAQPSS